jgi:WD40 repeat protein
MTASEHYDAFLSYARDDDDPFVARLHKSLVDAKLRVWWDRVDMPNRDLTFLQEIRDAIDASDRLIAVVGPRALASDYVRAEWEHARLFAKGVIAIPRLCGYEAIPADLARFDAPDFRSDASYDRELERLIEHLRSPVAPLGALSGVPALPPYYVARPLDLKTLQDLVLADVQRPVALGATAHVSSIHGMAGSGKSVLAAAFARIADTRRAFHRDGVVWASVGREPRLVDVARAIGAAFGEDLGEDVAAAYAKLQAVLQHRSCLIVLDDVWEVTHAERVVSALGVRCRLLITTRDAGVAAAFGPRRHPVDRVGDETALRLLEAYSGEPASAWLTEAKDVLAKCDRLPFAVALCGSMVRGGIPWKDVRDALYEADLEYLQARLPGYPHPDLLRAQQVSVDYLERDQAGSSDRYRDLVVFREDASVPEQAVATLWSAAGLSDRAARKLLATLDQKSLLRLTGVAPNRTISLHDLQHDYLRASVKDAQARHHRLVEAYRVRTNGRWARGADDGYYFQHLPRHLHASGEAAGFERLLFDFEWLQAKLERLGIVAVIEDFGLDPDERSPLRYLEDVLRRSAMTLSADPGQLAGQVLGHVGAFRMEDQLDRLLEGARGWRGRPWLRPLSGTLEPPGSALRATLAGHEGTPRSVAITPDGRWGVSAGNSQPDRTVRVWDLEKGVLVQILVAQAEAGGHTPLALTPDGELVLCALGAVINAWDCRTGKRVFSLEGHQAPVRAIAIDGLGRRLLSASADGVLTRWSLAEQTGEVIGRAEEPVEVVTLSATGRYGVIASRSHVERWDLDARTSVRLGVSLEGTGTARTGPYLALSQDGYAVYFGSPLRQWMPADGEAEVLIDAGSGARILAAAVMNVPVALATVDGQTIEIWDSALEGARPRADLPSQLAEITCVAITPDGRRAIVGLNDHLVKVWDVGVLPTLGFRRGGDPTRAAATRIDVSDDGRHAVTLRANGEDWIWDLESGQSWRHPSGHEALLDEIRARRAAEADLKAAVDKERGPKAPVGALGGPDSGLVLVTRVPEITDVALRAVHPDWAIEVREPPGKTSEASEPDRPTDNDYPLRVLDRRQPGATPAPLRGHSLPVTTVVISHDGRIAVSGGVGRTLRVWDLPSGTQRHLLRGHAGTIFSIALSEDATLAVSASEDRTVRCWDLRAGRLLATFTGELRMTTCALSPDGRAVIAGDGGGKVHLLRLELP